MDDVARILDASPWLTLGTTAPDGAPLATYAPFAFVPGGLAIVVSALAAHTKNLFEERRASVLVVDGATEAPPSYARPRVTLDCVVRTEACAAEAAGIWRALESRHGSIVQTLRTLPDFRPLVLEPLAARLVLGFGAARDVAGADIVRAIAACYALGLEEPLP